MIGPFLKVPDIVNAEVNLCVSIKPDASSDKIIVLAHRIDDTEKLSAYNLTTTNCTAAPAPGDYVIGVFTQNGDSVLKEPATPPTISIDIVPISEYYMYILIFAYSDFGQLKLTLKQWSILLQFV